VIDEALMTSEDATSARARAALCGYCRRELPEQVGGGRRLEYCPPGTGPHDPEATCKQLASAVRLLRAVRGTDTVAGADLELLGEQVSAVLAVFDPNGPIEALRGLLNGVTGRLDGAVATAHTERDQAREAERAALGEATTAARLRSVAERQAHEAIAAQAKAEQARGRAERRAEQAEAAQRRAEQDLGRAEASRDTHEARAERAEEAAETARQLRHEAETAATALRSELDTLRAQLTAADQRADRERDRADQAAAELNRIRTEAEARVDRIRTEAEHSVAAARAEADQAVVAARTELTQRTEAHTTLIRDLERERAEQLADRDRRLDHATLALAHLRRDVHTELSHLRRLVPAAEDAAELRDRVDDLIRRTAG
jgi:DNA repair exonuclease SbcCD ATPase subunit